MRSGIQTHLNENCPWAKREKQWRSTIGETSVSRHHGATIEGSPETRLTSQHYRIKRFKGGPQLIPHYAESLQSLGQQMLIFPSQKKWHSNAFDFHGIKWLQILQLYKVNQM